jgi:hypothetical protein
MTLQLTLPAELEERLRREAERQQTSPDAIAMKLLDEHLPREFLSSAEKAAALRAMLEQWNAEDEAMTEEEMASNAAVLRAIDENRSSDRKLFTDILKDLPP